MAPLPDLSSLDSAQKDALIVALHAQVERLEQQVRELMARLGMDSTTSSKPPSSDGYGKPGPKSTRGKSGKRSGGQKGHKGSTLERVAEPDHVVEHRPGQCVGCGTSLEDAVVVASVARQVFDTPDPSPLIITEHRALTVACPCCRARSHGRFPEGVRSATQYGPNVQAIALYLSQYQHLPYARLAECLEELFGVSISEGTLDNMLRRAEGRLEGFETAAKTMLAASPTMHCDESGVRVGGKLHWLHVASTALVTCYLIHARRGRKAMEAMGLLGGYRGYAVHDGLTSYFTFEGLLHVLCNAHHLRELAHAHEAFGQRWAKRMGNALRAAKKEVEVAKAAGATRLEDERLDAIERRYRRCLAAGRAELPQLAPAAPGKRGRAKRHKVVNLHERLVVYEPEVLAFVYDFAHPFDNNQAERDVRMVKVKQKVSGGFRSIGGARAFCRLRGYISTAKKQGRSVYGALRDMVEGRAFDPSTAALTPTG